jgi:site-specific recombinase XerD
MRPILEVAPVRDKPKLLDLVRDVIRRKHYSIRTEQAYVDWIKRFIIYHNKRHPAEMAEEEVAQFLTHLARDLDVAASTQNQALSALLFLYKEVLKQEIGWLEKVERARKPAKLPVVLTRSEVKEIFAHLHGTQAYGWFALRKRIAVDGMCSPTGQGYRLRAGTNHSA